MKGKIEIAPSLLCADLLNLEKDIKLTVNAGADLLHIDIMDSYFVEGFGFNLPQIYGIKDISTLMTDFHIMVTYCLDLAIALSKLDNSRIIIHVESKDFHKAYSYLTLNNINFGIAIKPETDLSCLNSFAKRITTVLLFTVNPGKRGQKILENSKQRIQFTRNILDLINPTCSLQVDGGVYIDVIRNLLAWGANIFVVGSSFYGTTKTETIEDVNPYKELCDKLKNELLK